MYVETACVLALIFTLIACVLLYVFVLPKRKDGHLNPFLQALHTLFHFKKFYLERILKFVYIVSTCFCILFGFLLLFSRVEYYSSSFFSSSSYSESTLAQGLIFMILFPILLRISYEFIMLLILAVKNLMEMNRKLDPIVTAATKDTPPESKFLYCTQCGTHYDTTKGKCPKCGKE